MAGERIAMNAVAAITLALDKRLVVADYAASKTLGGFILIDRFSNETVAIGMIDSRIDTSDIAARKAVAATAQLGLAGKLRLRAEAIAGVAGSRARKRFEAALAWRALTGLCLFVIAFALSGSAGMAALIALVDAVIRPLLFALHRKFWASRLRVGDNNDAGGGI